MNAKLSVMNINTDHENSWNRVPWRIQEKSIQSQE